MKPDVVNDDTRLLGHRGEIIKILTLFYNGVRIDTREINENIDYNNNSLWDKIVII